MLTQEMESTIQAYLLSETDDNERGYLYFDFYYSSKELNEENALRLIEETIGDTETSNSGTLEEDGVIVRIEGAPILFWENKSERWLVCYSSTHLSKSNRQKLTDAHKKIGWLLPAQFESKIVDEIYHDYSPKDESVTIERKWDPYWIYERGSEIPENLRGYYRDNIEEFVEKEIEFNVRTPGWLVDTALKEGVQRDLLDKSEISKSRFTYDPNVSPKAASDGGISAESFRSSVTIRQEGRIVHRSGVPEATFEMMDEMDFRDELFEEFSAIIPEITRSKRDNGIVEFDSYRPGGELSVIFKKKEFNEEASIKLSNLLTVGQDDVDLHGVVQWRDELEFLAEAYTPFDDGEYRVLFTSTETEPGVERPTLHISPRSATTAGLVYLFRKLKEKFDPRIDYEINQHPSEEVAI